MPFRAETPFWKRWSSWPETFRKLIRYVDGPHNGWWGGTKERHILLSWSKLYNHPNGIITVLIALYLLVMLIVVVKITNIK
jgi:hypothetical protein